MRRIMLLMAVIFCLASPCALFAADASALNVSPKSIEIGTFFNGTTITADGEIPDGSEVVLRFVGESCDIPVKQRGKVFGIMWMNLDSLVIRKVPSVCIVNSSSGTMDPSPDKPDKEKDSLGLSGLVNEARIEANGSNQDGIFDEFLKLKKSEGLYREKGGTVNYGPASNGLKSFRAEIAIPARLAPGQYRVEMAVLRDGKITDRTGEGVKVTLVGFPELLSNLAFGHAALYGILSTVIALIAGLAIGLVFQSKGGH